MQLIDQIENSNWRTLLKQCVPEKQMTSLGNFLDQAIKQEAVFPPKTVWFRALNEVDMDAVKVVILGQDPYHGLGQAQGLSFSVPDSAKLPPSLRNIFKEQKADLNINNTCGDLTRWSEQGVLLLNAVLTVQQGVAGSHAKKGWEDLTDGVMKIVNEHTENVVFMLWGAYAEKKRALIDEDKHLILSAAHPSPLSAHRGWFGSGHFSKANHYLQKHHKRTINWATSAESADQLPLL